LKRVIVRVLSFRNGDIRRVALVLQTLNTLYRETFACETVAALEMKAPS
jgi:hypothetical protein